jgi:hypothetical protein
MSPLLATENGNDTTPDAPEHFEEPYMFPLVASARTDDSPVGTAMLIESLQVPLNEGAAGVVGFELWWPFALEAATPMTSELAAIAPTRQARLIDAGLLLIE